MGFEIWGLAIQQSWEIRAGYGTAFEIAACGSGPLLAQFRVSGFELESAHQTVLKKAEGFWGNRLAARDCAAQHVISEGTSEKQKEN